MAFFPVRARSRRIHAEHADFAVCDPLRGFQSQGREIREELRRAESAIPAGAINDFRAGLEFLSMRLKHLDGQRRFGFEMAAGREVDQAGRAVELLKPHLVEQGVKPVAKVAIGTVKGDLHDIGKKLVSMMLEGSGFEIMDLGIDVPPDKFVDAVRQGAQVVALSALLTTTMPNMKNVVEAIQQAGLRENTRIIIGGAPVNQAYADHIGADGYAPDASSAVRKVRELVGVQ